VGASTSDGVSIAGMKILLVEDNAMNQKLVHHTISQAGGAVTICVHGKAAVDAVTAAGEGHFDAILMDHMMPVMDGVEATRLIRKLEATGSLKRNVIIGLSGNVGTEFAAEIYAVGMDGFMSKPFLPKELRALLSSVFKGEFKSRNPAMRNAEDKKQI